MTNFNQRTYTIRGAVTIRDNPRRLRFEYQQGNKWLPLYMPFPSDAYDIVSSLTLDDLVFDDIQGFNLYTHPITIEA